MSSLLGNPHSASSSSQLSSRRIENARLQTLRFLNANPDQFDVVFVANATAGIKLVAEALREQDNGFWYGYHADAHTSLLGIREVASQGHKCFESDREVEQWLGSPGSRCGMHSEAGIGLFAYPAQSNMNGRRLPLDWPAKLRSFSHSKTKCLYSLLDAAAFLSTSPLDLSNSAESPDFIVLSFNKIFGFPDLGALIVRRESGHVLRNRRYFGGGTVEIATCLKESWHIKKEGSLHDQLEDGTLPVHSIVALESAFETHGRLFGSFKQISSHTTMLAQTLDHGLQDLRHANGESVCKIYKSSSASHQANRSQGSIVAFNLRTPSGAWVSNAEVEKLAAIKNIHLRSGGLCNPGGIASSLELEPWEMKRNFSAGHRCGTDNDIMGGKPTGMLRVSFGAMSVMQDVTTFLNFIKEFFVDNRKASCEISPPPPAPVRFYVESATIYPIKSCGGWKIPCHLPWDVKPEGLAWDREWYLVHQGSRAALSQKRYPKMALLKPVIDLENGLMRVRFDGPTSPSTSVEIAVPLSADPTVFSSSANLKNGAPLSSKVCEDEIIAKRYSSGIVSLFFSNVLGVPCHLARFPAGGSDGMSVRHAKAHLQPYQRANSPSNSNSMPGSFPLSKPAKRPSLLSNESPILTISRSSLNRLNENIKQSGGKAAPAEAFRANIVVAEDPSLPPGVEQPYVEDTWRHMKIGSQYFELLGSCRRCQMVCVDQTTAEKSEEPFVTLAKTRRFDGKVFFGQHCGLLLGNGNVEAGEAKRIMVGDRVLPFRDGEEDADEGLQACITEANS